MKTIFVFIVLLVVLWIGLLQISKRFHYDSWKWDLKCVALVLIVICVVICDFVCIIISWVNMSKDMIAMIFSTT